MLTLQINPIKSPQKAAKYYVSKENYYAMGERHSAWAGKGAEKLGLVGDVHVQDLENLLSGLLPNGHIIGFKTQTGEIIHRGGYDLTFSAPKSISYLALVCGHKEFITLHEKAVAKVLNIIEEEAACARKSDAKGVHYEKTGNLCFATIVHDTSRELDPELHTHALLMNATERADGNWRALASDTRQKRGTMEWIMDNQIYLGMVYRSEIAMGLKECDLDIEKTGDPHGLFEIKHFDKDLLRNYSKRRIDIEKDVEQQGSNSLKAHDKAMQKTRKIKKAASEASVRSQWEEESRALKIEPSTYLEYLKTKTIEKLEVSNQLKEINNQKDEISPIDLAIAHLEEKKLSFSYQDILQTGLYFSLGKSSIDELISGIAESIGKEKLVPLDTKERLFTTQTLIEKEKNLLNQLTQTYKKGFKVKINPTELTKDSVEYQVACLLTDSSNIVRVKQQGVTEKEVIKACIHLMNNEKNVRILTTSASSANALNEVLKKPAQGIWQWLVQLGKADIAQTVRGFNHQNEHAHKLPFFSLQKKPEILIVDDVKRLNLKDLQVLLQIAEKTSAKVLLLEKSNSLTGFTSDLPELFNKAKVKTWTINNTLMKNTPINMIQVSEKTKRLTEVAEHYLNLSSMTRSQTQVLTHSKLEARTLNALIRTGLQIQEVLGNEEKIINTLVKIPLTESEKKIATNYPVGGILFHTTRTESKKLTILSINEENNRLNVRDKEGRKYCLEARQINDKSQAYESVTLPLAIGEKLLVTANDPIMGIKAGEKYQIAGFTRFGITLEKNNKTKNLILEEGKHYAFAHDYAKSIHSIHPEKSPNIIFTLPAYALRKNTLNQVQELSKENLTLITDDIEKAKRYAKEESKQVTAIDLTLNAASSHNLLSKIDNATTSALLETLDNAIAALSGGTKLLTDSEAALHFAITHLSEHEAVFKQTDVLKIALMKALGQSNREEIGLVLKNLENEGLLIAAPDSEYTTKDALNFETEILTLVKAERGCVSPLMNNDIADIRLQETTLTEGQKAACKLITTTPDRFIMIQGYAGTGKTTMTKTVIEVIAEVEKNSPLALDVIALAPTHQAVNEMKALGIKGQTLKSFLIAENNAPALKENSLVILDESSMVSNRDFKNLVNFIADAKARCVFLGDISQHQSIESGKPSALLLKTNTIDIAYMDNIVRQQVESYKVAVEDLINGKSDIALQQLNTACHQVIERKSEKDIFAMIKSSIVEVKNKNDKDDESTPPNKTLSSKPEINVALQDKIHCIEDNTPLNMVVMDYLSRTPNCRENTLVIIHDNKTREIANQKIREGLQQEEVLGGENILFTRLLNTNFTTAELYHSETYRDILQEGTPHFIKKNNQYFEVKSLDEENKVVFLKDEQGKTCVFMPEKESQDWKIELFRKLPGMISLGEKIQFKKSDKGEHRFANEKLVVTSVEKEGFTVKDRSGKNHVLLKDALKDTHWDYSYTATSYSVQGASSRFVIGLATTTNKALNHLRSFYIMASRGSMHAMFYTDDYGRLKKQLYNQPDKTSAIEALNPEIYTKSSKSNPSMAVDKDIQKEIEPRPSPESNLKPITVNKPFQYDANAIVENLTLNTESVVSSLLGSPNEGLSSKKEMRYGTKGSLSICLQGEKRGTWFNFETGDKGNLLHLIQQTLHLNFKDSLEYAALLTGDDISMIRSAIAPKNTKSSESKTDKTRDYAIQLTKESQPIKGTLAERYLQEHRAIENISGNSLRFHPRVYTSKNETIKYRPALLCIVHDKEGRVVSTQATFLDETTGTKANIPVNKRKYGNSDGYGVIISEGEKEGTTVLLEGLETGLSVRDAMPNARVIISLGINNLKNLNPETMTDNVLLGLDNDLKPFHKNEGVIKAVVHLTNHGKNLLLVQPENKGDFNDIAMQSGKKSVVESLSKTVPPPMINHLDGCIDVEKYKKLLQPKEITLKSLEPQTDKHLERIEREIY